MARPFLYGTAAVVFLAMIIGAVAAGEASFAIPIALVALLVFAFFLFNDALARRQLERHGGDEQAVQADEDDALPTAHVIADDDTALGDTAEAHAEVSPHDFPKDSPARHAAEEQAAQNASGTTRGGEQDADDDPAGDSKSAGYPDGHPSSGQAKSVGSP